MDTPILFIVFNRLETTKKVFNSLRKVRPLKLYVSADGPRMEKEGESEIIEEVRKFILDHIDWDCQVKTLFRDTNLGCKMAVSSAIDWFFEHETEGIILEDDCLPDISFFYFCKELLEYYREDNRIMMISGTNFFVTEPEISNSYFFSRYFAIWGWATWRRAWNLYDIEMNEWERVKERDQLAYLVDGYFTKMFFKRMFDTYRENQIDTWDIQWVYTCLFNSGLSIIPKYNLVSNIGVEGTHTPKKVSENLFIPVKNLPTENLVHPKHMYPNLIYDRKFHRVKTRPDVIKGMLRDFKRKIRSFVMRKKGDKCQKA